MRDLYTKDGVAEKSDLSSRMADNVVQALHQYMQAPGSATAEMVHAYSTALSSLSLLAIAEQLQALNVALEPNEEPGEDDEALCVWAWSNHHWYGACGYQATAAVDDTVAGNGGHCPGCGAVIHRTCLEVER